MKKKKLVKSLQLSKSNIASLSDKKLHIVNGGGSEIPQLCPTFIPIQCLVTDRYCNFTETYRTCPV